MSEESVILFRSLEVPANTSSILDRLATMERSPDPRAKAIIDRVADEFVVREEIVSSQIKPVLNADVALIGARLGQCQAYKDRLSQIYHDVDFAYDYYKRFYDMVKAVVMSSKQIQVLKTIGERETEANSKYLANEYERVERYKALRDAIQLRQSLLAAEGETLSRQLSALTLQWTLVQAKGGRVQDLSWDTLDVAQREDTSAEKKGRGW